MGRSLPAFLFGSSMMCGAVVAGAFGRRMVADDEWGLSVPLGHPTASPYSRLDDGTAARGPSHELQRPPHVIDEPLSLGSSMIFGEGHPWHVRLCAWSPRVWRLEAATTPSGILTPDKRLFHCVMTICNNGKYL